MNKTLATLLTLIVIAVLAFFGFRYYQDSKKAPPAEEKPFVTVSPVDSTSLPEKFPANFPLEKDVPINSNFNASGEGVYQSTRQFISNKTLAENYKIYTDFLKKDGWTIEATLDQEEIKSIFAKKSDRYNVTVTMNKSSIADEVTVDISFTYR